MGDPAYAAALGLLARGELSEARLRAKLTRRGHDEASIEEAIVRLRTDRSLDDRRAALALARVEAGRRRGRRRVQQRLAAAGIPDAVAARAIDEVFAEIDEAALLRAALDRRLGGAGAPGDDRALARLYRQLTAQGFDPGQVRALLRHLPRGAPGDR